MSPRVGIPSSSDEIPASAVVLGFPIGCQTAMMAEEKGSDPNGTRLRADAHRVGERMFTGLRPEKQCTDARKSVVPLSVPPFLTP
jgi:hypothetical protein